jgi:hypothetical protein
MRLFYRGGVIHEHIRFRHDPSKRLTENDADEEIAPCGRLLRLMKLQQLLGDGRRVRPRPGHSSISNQGGVRVTAITWGQISGERSVTPVWGMVGLVVANRPAWVGDGR